MQNKDKLYQYLSGFSLIGGVLILVFFFRASDLAPSNLLENIPALGGEQEENPIENEVPIEEQVVQDIDDFGIETDELLADLISDLEG